MKKVFNYSIIIALFVAVGFASCEKFNIDSIVGEWQMMKEVYYFGGEKQENITSEKWNFTSDGRLIVEGKDAGQYTIEGKTLKIKSYGENVSWQIEKLTKKELIIRQSAGKDYYEYHFKKVS